MDQPSVEKAWILEPEVEGTFSWAERAVTFTPTGDGLEPRTTCTDDPGAHPAETCPATWSWKGLFPESFSTVERRPEVSFEWNVEVLLTQPGEPVRVSYYSERSRPAMKIDIYRLTAEQFGRRYVRHYHAGEDNGSLISWAEADPVASWGEDSEGLRLELWLLVELLAATRPAFRVLPRQSLDLQVEDQRFLLVTDTYVTVKSSGGGVPSATTSDGRPVHDVDIQVFAADGRIVGEGDTDEDGIFETWVFGSSPPVLVLARRGIEFSAVGIEALWNAQSYGCGFWLADLHQTVDSRQRPPFGVDTYTDRPVYRPGDTVSFKAILRRYQDAILDLPVAGVASVRVLDARRNEIHRVELPLSDFGTIHGDMHLPDGAMLGIEICHYQGLPGGLLVVAQIFKVEDDRKPDYEVTVAEGADQYISGDQIPVTLEAVVISSASQWSTLKSACACSIWAPIGNWRPGRLVGPTKPGGCVSPSRRLISEWSWDWEELADFDAAGVFQGERRRREPSGGLGRCHTAGLRLCRVSHLRGRRVLLRSWTRSHLAGQGDAVRSEPRRGSRSPLRGQMADPGQLEWRRFVSRSSATSSSDGVAPSAYRPEKPGWYTVYASARDEGKFIMELEQWLYVEGGISASQDDTLLKHSVREGQLWPPGHGAVP